MSCNDDSVNTILIKTVPEPHPSVSDKQPLKRFTGGTDPVPSQKLAEMISSPQE